jgi:hypothetical protein
MAAAAIASAGLPGAGKNTASELDSAVAGANADALGIAPGQSTPSSSITSGAGAAAGSFLLRPLGAHRTRCRVRRAGARPPLLPQGAARSHAARRHALRAPRAPVRRRGRTRRQRASASSASAMGQSHSVSCAAGAESSDAASAAWSKPGKLGRDWMSRCGPEVERTGAGKTGASSARSGLRDSSFTESSVGRAQRRSCGV